MTLETIETGEEEDLFRRKMPSIDLKNRYIVPPRLRGLLEQLESRGFEAYIVGGAVRDIFLGKTPFDFDVPPSLV